MYYCWCIDSAFTERILGLPGDNYKGYVEADATQRARHIPSHSLYLMHGLADLTAPYQHSVALARALTDAGVIFRYQVTLLRSWNVLNCVLVLYVILYCSICICLELRRRGTPAGGRPGACVPLHGGLLDGVP